MVHCDQAHGLVLELTMQIPWAINTKCYDKTLFTPKSKKGMSVPITDNQR